jgi:hypothetical protein
MESTLRATALELWDRVRRGGVPAREIGPIATASRVVGGLLFLVIPTAMHGITWWDIAAALLGLPLLAGVVAAGVGAAWRRWPGSAGGSVALPRAAAGLVVVVVLGVAIGLTFISPIDGVAVWAFVGLSMLLAALRGYGGCEVLAVPRLFDSAASSFPCVLYAPIDAAEGRRRDTRSGP